MEETEDPAEECLPAAEARPIHLPDAPWGAGEENFNIEIQENHRIEAGKVCIQHRFSASILFLLIKRIYRRQGIYLKEAKIIVLLPW